MTVTSGRYTRPIRIFLISSLLILFTSQFLMPSVLAHDNLGEFVMGVPANFPPQYYVDEETGEPYGFAIDMMDYIALKSGIDVHYVVFDTCPEVLQALSDGTIDAIPNIGITDQRKEIMDFTVPVEAYHLSIFVRHTTTDINNVDDLNGRKVAVVITNNGLYIMEEYEEVDLVTYNSINEAFLSLISGNVDALVYPEPTVLQIAYQSNLDEHIKVVGEPLREIKRGIAVHKDYPELMSVLDKEIKAFVTTPEYGEMYAKWYGHPEPYWNTNRVATAMGIILVIIVILFLTWHYFTVVGLNKSLKRSIAERERVGDTLKESEGRFKTMFNEAPLGIALIDSLTGHIYDVNPMFVKIAGRTEEEMSKIDWMTITHPDDVQEVLDNMALLNAGKFNGFQMEKRYMHPDGTAVWINMTIAPINVKDKSQPRHLCMIENITERKQTEEIMQLNSLRMNALLDLNRMIKASFSDIADFVLANVSFVTKSEYGFVGLMNKDESVFFAHSWAKDVTDICLIDDKSIEFPIETAGIWGDAVRKRKVIIVNDYTDPNTHQTGLPEGHVPLSRILSIPIFEDNKIVAVATVANKETNYDDSDVMQITLLMDGMWKLIQRQKAEEKLKKYAEELARSNEKLKSLDKMKDEFLSNVSHELKTPLISIQGFTEVMQDELYGPLNDKQKKAMDAVLRNSERLGRLINSILYLTLQKSGRDTYTTHPVNITEIIGNAIIDISPQANSKDLTIENNTQSDLPLIKGDMDKLTQVFINLIENAIKFTPNGGKITMAAFEDGENIHNTVTDTGIGVSADVISNLFERFYQVDASTTRHYGGTGIGLYISKLIVEVHKGKIWAESEEGAGTTFHVVLPK